MNPATYASFSFGPNPRQSRPASCVGPCSRLAGAAPLPNKSPSPIVPSAHSRPWLPTISSTQITSGELISSSDALRLLPLLHSRRAAGKCEHQHHIAQRISELIVPTACDGDVLLAVHRVAHRRCIASGATIECPQRFSCAGIVRVEVAISLAREDEIAGRR